MPGTQTLPATAHGGVPNDPQATKFEIDSQRQDLAGESSGLWRVYLVNLIDQDLAYEKLVVASSETSALELAWQAAGLPKADETHADYTVHADKVCSVGERRPNPRA